LWHPKKARNVSGLLRNRPLGVFNVTKKLGEHKDEDENKVQDFSNTKLILVFVVVLTQTPEARRASYFGFIINVKCEDLSKGNMSQNNDTLGCRKKSNRYAGVPSTFARNVSHMNATYKKVPLPTQN